jgi:hypothetical protein
MGAIALAGVRAIGHRDKLRLQAAQAIDGFPQGLLHFTGARRKEFKGHINLALHFRQALIQGFPLIGVKKLIPYLINRILLFVVLRTSIRLDVQM